MFNQMGYFSYRDVYPMQLGLSTREKTNLNSLDMEKPSEVKEVNVIDKVNINNQGDIIKSLAVIILVVVLVSRLGK
jgi:hypothetical protein